MKHMEFKVKFINGSLILSDELINFLKSSGLSEFKIKLEPDIDEVCKREKISKKVVHQIAKTQGIPLDVALNLVRSKGKLAE